MSKQKIAPILLNGEEIKTVLEQGRIVIPKLIKPQPVCSYPRDCGCTIWNHGKTDDACDRTCLGLDTGKELYQPGDILYSRETWDYLEGWKLRDPGIDGKYFYRADGDFRPIGWRGNWQPSVHMPKEATRLWLQVSDIKVEKLQDITTGDCEKAGVLCRRIGDVSDFMKTWDSALKKSDREKYGWDANPWIWRIEFERCENPET